MSPLGWFLVVVFGAEALEMVGAPERERPRITARRALLTLLADVVLIGFIIRAGV